MLDKIIKNVGENPRTDMPQAGETSTQDIVNKALKIKPNFVCIVPEKRNFSDNILYVHNFLL